MTGAGPAPGPAVWAELGRVKELSASFTEVQHRAILKSPLTSAGTVRFTRPDTLVWSVTSPARSTFSLAGTVATMDYPDLQQHERIDLGAVPDANRLASSLLVWMRADAVAVDRDFTVAYTATGATLTPKDPKLQALVARIELTLGHDPAWVRDVALVEPDGDRSEIHFSGVTLDGVAVGN